MKLCTAWGYKILMFLKHQFCIVLSILLSISQMHLAAQSNAPAEWTILVYAQAKNNLSNFAYKNFNDMATIGSGSNLNILVQWFQPEQQGIWRYKVEKGKMVLDVCLPSNTDGNKSSDLVDSMRWAVTKYPAKKYFLILWNHGIGILDPVWGHQRPWSTSSKFLIDPAVLKDNPKICISGITHDSSCQDSTDNNSSEQALVDNNSSEQVLVDNNVFDEDQTDTNSYHHRGILFNEQSKTYMNNQTLTSALSEINVSVLKNQKLDILGMDACLMAMTEVGYQSYKHVKYLVASQEVELAYGWNYASFIQTFAAGRATPLEAARSIVSSYQMLYKDKIQFYTQSALDLSQIERVKTSLDTVVQYLTVCQRIDRDSLHEAVKRARRSCLQFSATSYIDLHSFCIELNKSIEQGFDKKFSNNYAVVQVKNALKESIAAIEACVVANAAGTHLARARGMSIYFPISHIDASYQHTDFAKNSLWFNFLKEVVYR